MREDHGQLGSLKYAEVVIIVIIIKTNMIFSPLNKVREMKGRMCGWLGNFENISLKVFTVKRDEKVQI